MKAFEVLQLKLMVMMKLSSCSNKILFYFFYQKKIKCKLDCSFKYTLNKIFQEQLWFKKTVKSIIWRQQRQYFHPTRWGCLYWLDDATEL